MDAQRIRGAEIFRREPTGYSERTEAEVKVVNNIRVLFLLSGLRIVSKEGC
jgi:hypothetical protein